MDLVAGTSWLRFLQTELYFLRACKTWTKQLGHIEVTDEMQAGPDAIYVICDICESEANADDFATAASAEWTNFRPKDRHKLISLHWRSQSSSNGYGGSASGRLDVAWLEVSGEGEVPALPRLRGIASLNGMAIAKLTMKPSSLKTLGALPRNGLAVYLNGSLLNHSCCPTVNRPGSMYSRSFKNTRITY